jgi:predicted acetyltransferase
MIVEREKMEKFIQIGSEKFMIRQYRDDDETGVRKLWKAAFGKEMPMRLWYWKYLNNPYKRQMIICVAETGETVVSYTGIPYRTNLQGQTVEMSQLMDIMSHPEYRKTGLFIKTAHIFFEIFGKDILFVYGFPGKYHYDIGEKYLGYQALTRTVSYLSAQTDALARQEAGCCRSEPITEIDASFDGLWEKCLDDYPFSIIRNADFVRWRFFDHPMKNYEIFGCRKNSGPELLAYAVFSVEGKNARMADILAPVSEESIGDFMCQTALLLKDSGIERIETWLPENHFITQALISAGFINAPEPLGIIPTVRNFERAPRLEWTSEHLYYTMADADLV